MKYLYIFLTTKKLVEMHDIALIEDDYIKHTNIALELRRRARLDEN